MGAEDINISRDLAPHRIAWECFTAGSLGSNASCTPQRTFRKIIDSFPRAQANDDDSLPPHTANKSHIFSRYKGLEHKHTATSNALTRSSAIQAVRDGMEK